MIPRDYIMRPDLIGFKRDSKDQEHRLLVEIHVTHRVDAVKLARIQAANLNAIEIDLSDLARFAAPAVIRDAILHGAPRKWLHHHRIPETRKRLEATANEHEARRRRETAHHGAHHRR